MNKYLEKVAKKEKDKGTSDKVRGGVAIAAGGSLAASAPSHLLGYHTLRHGTSKEIAKKIKQEGFDPKKGGTRNAASQKGFKDQSKGKVHFTKNRGIAYVFSGNPGQSIKEGRPSSMFGDAAKRALTQGKTVTARVPHSMFGKMKVDPHMGSSKNIASTYDKKVGTQYIAGAKGYKGRRQYLSLKNLKQYLSTESGKKRFAKGVVKGGAGTALMALGAKKISDSVEKKAENMNKYLEKIAQGFSQLEQPTQDSSGTAKAVGVGAATAAGGAAGMAGGRKLATGKAVQSKITERAPGVGERSAVRVKERAGRRIDAQKAEIKKLDKGKSTYGRYYSDSKGSPTRGSGNRITPTVDPKTKKTPSPKYDQSKVNTLGKQKELREGVIKKQTEKARQAGTTAGKAAKSNKFIARSTELAKKKLGAKGALIGAGLALGAAGTAALTGKKKEG